MDVGCGEKKQEKRRRVHFCDGSTLGLYNVMIIELKNRSKRVYVCKFNPNARLKNKEENNKVMSVLTKSWT